MKLIYLVLIITSAGCNYSNHNSVVTKDSTPSNADTNVENPAIPVLATSDSIINVTFPKGAKAITVEGNMRGIDKPVTVLIAAKKGQSLSALLIPEDTTANIRINQVIFADSKADGPFGRELHKKIPTEGTLKLIIAENKMQGEEWKGKFTLNLKLQ
jgi:hypothetical protein